MLLAGGVGPLLRGVARGMAGGWARLLASGVAVLVMIYAVRFHT